MAEAIRVLERATCLDFDIAREIATRENAKAVLDGEVVKRGQRFVVSARLVSSIDGAKLASFRQTADGEDDLVAALGRLSHRPSISTRPRPSRT